MRVGAAPRNRGAACPERRDEVGEQPGDRRIDALDATQVDDHGVGRPVGGECLAGERLDRDEAEAALELDNDRAVPVDGDPLALVCAALTVVQLTVILPQLLLSVVLFPIVARVVSMLDRLRLMRVRRIG